MLRIFLWAGGSIITALPAMAAPCNEHIGLGCRQGSCWMERFRNTCYSTRNKLQNLANYVLYRSRKATNQLAALLERAAQKPALP